MSLLKGSVSLTRYKVLDAPAELTEEFFMEKIRKNQFTDIDSIAEVESIGWVETLSPFSANLDAINIRFGDIVILGLRHDTRNLPAKIVKRYLSIAERQAEASDGKPLTAEHRRELKIKVMHELLARTPVTTTVTEVSWFMNHKEVWLTGTGTKLRQVFEDLWRRTFGFGLLMKIPFIMAGDFLPESAPEGALDRIKASALFGGGE